MNKNGKFNTNILEQDDIGFLFRKLEEIENFYPCYRSMIKKEE